MLSFLKKKNTPLTEIFPANFTDIHCHFIPGIDDGAKSLEDSVAMLKRMHGYGINNIICTPHIMDGIYDNTSELILQKLTVLQEHLTAIGFTDIQLRAAAEYMLDANFDSLLKEKKLLTLKDQKVLVEMSYQGAPINLYEQLFAIQIAGYKPVLAHPERYNFLHNNYSEYLKLKEAGCLFQLNLLSLTNYYGKDVNKIALKMLKDGLIDYVGTDTHNQYQLDTLETINNPTVLKLIAPILKNHSHFL